MVPKTDVPETVSVERVPTEVSDDETTFEASDVPVSEPAGAEPPMLSDEAVPEKFVPANVGAAPELIDCGSDRVIAPVDAEAEI